MRGPSAGRDSVDEGATAVKWLGFSAVLAGVAVLGPTEAGAGDTGTSPRSPTPAAFPSCG